MALSANSLFGMGNVLLDMLANVEDEFLAKYGLKRDDQILADEKHSNLYDELAAKYNVTYHPGGSAFNTIKIAQWMLNTPVKVSTYFGCLGKDKYGDIFRNYALKSNVDARFYEVDNVRTGICASCITGKNRSMVTELGAALHYSKEKHLDLPENWKLVEQAEYYYICGYFLTVSPNSILRITKHAAENNKWFLFNISASFVPHVYKDSLSDVLKYVDVLFGNDEEARTFAEVFGFNTDDLHEIVKKMQALPKENKKRDRVVVVTCNKNDTIAATVEGVKLFPVANQRQDDIVDTTGAGDGFAGGFLSQLILNKSLKECVEAGHYVASVLIRVSGVVLPEKPNYP